MTNYPLIDFKRNTVEPIECLKGGWELVKDQYWLFVGICAVAMIVGSLVPLGILMGPMMCGVYLAFFQKRRGQPVDFNLLFKGFDYFGQSVIATLIHMVPVLIIFVPSYIIFYVALLTMTMGSRGSEPDPGRMFAFFGIFFVFWMVMILLLIIVSIGFTFVYPLIVNRGLSAVDAVKLSFRAAMANFWRLLGLSILSFLMGMVGVLLCYVGILLVFPVTFAALSIAYQQVFGITEPTPNMPPPPPIFH